ncbi:hypothetical protein PIB30_007883 [Stylosanthes scabra]|uniref:Disease resistance RPP13-like protein 1 n=1 Tax=Stylosanthes scabra TaxID=79078 RepID=A0ABU6R5A5_9FABA|nr:hypothetical protein [Stylosanthes scabra]
MSAKLEGRALLSSFIDSALMKLSTVNSIPARKPDEQKLLRRLRANLRAVRPFLDDAEQKQFKDPEVKTWLVNLQDALYMADDLLDELSTKAVVASLTQTDPGTSSSSWSHYVDDILEVSNYEMEDLVVTLESLVEEKDEFPLEKAANKDLEDLSWRNETTSLLEGSEIYGRDEEKEEIIGMLLDDTCDGKLSVISIEGMGGVGKTTLAQLVYHDARVKAKFDIRAWVSVATKFDPVMVTKAVIQEVDSSSPCHKVSLNSLQTELQEKLTGKAFLVVLDDVWDNQQNLWDNFLKPFLYGNKGSKILLTTRTKNVDSVVATNLHHTLYTLSHENCWSIFLKHSSLSTNSSQCTSLESIGSKIVEKCKGLPLAVKTLGGLLRNKSNERYWNDILESRIWELPEDESKIVPALRISYDSLPSHLKRCFVYCSLYPEDYQFDKDELISLWMAEDMLQPMGKRTLEEIGCAYFNELVARSFFQPSSSNRSLFVMHDLMHDLATFFAGKFYFRVKELDNPLKIDIKTRHLSCIVNRVCPISKLLEACNENMRTFLIPAVKSDILNEYFEMENNSCLFLLQLKYLRALSFKCFPLNALPESIDGLIHLHYLDLSFTPIVRLSESLCNLYNLQTLKLRHCYCLEMLPEKMQDLVNLRYLDIHGASSLKEMCRGMSKLKNLNFLSDYIVGEHDENGIRELAALENLRGSFRISKLQNVKNSGEALEAKISDKKHIDILLLFWGDEGSVDDQTSRDILDKLQPHAELKELSVTGYRGKKFPDWLGFSSYRSMTKLELSYCKNCSELPCLGQLPSLKHLNLFNLDGLERIGCEFYKSNKSFEQETPFKSLESLTFRYMSCWEEWHFPDEFDGFPQLKRLSIHDCDVLTGNLPGYLPALEKLIIEGCEELACSLPRAPKLHELKVSGEMRMEEAPESLREITIDKSALATSVLECVAHTQPPHLQCIVISNCSPDISISWDHLPASLQELNIWCCSNLTFSGQMRHSIKEICISDCGSLKLFPLVALPKLEKLQIYACRNLECIEVPQDHDDHVLPSLRELSILFCPLLVSISTLVLAAPHLEELTITCCSRIDSFLEGGLPPSLRVLDINYCPKLTRSIILGGLHDEGLTRLSLSGCYKVKSFPREGCLPTSLESLRIRKFRHLETLDCKALLHLTSLRKLNIWQCWNLRNMTEESLPASITKLTISECPLRSKLKEMNNPLINSEDEYYSVSEDSESESEDE